MQPFHRLIPTIQEFHKTMQVRTLILKKRMHNERNRQWIEQGRHA